ncbi:netrin receptor UNC5B-like [Strongylocentrotus purpuratus]|uniref:ZU5 domain-containing protein n=1 Tax=Strongylocentrotus purpuratus TaxID=7668 RepID=A0A7M7PEY2_STRPU|nr:netrin receptor UNC5B-like [Strongylocentrotus purpuratus]
MSPAKEFLQLMEQHLRKSPSSDEPYARKTIGSKGGILRVKGHGVTLNIPSGALTGNRDIKVQLLGEELPEEFTSKDEVSLCPSVRCFPSGLTFRDPVQLTLTHCAELTEQILSGEGELLLYTREDSQRGSGDQNITRTKLVPPGCEFFRDRINIYVKQFADCWIRIKSNFIHGKKVGCLPFVPIEMPRTRRPIVRCSIYDLTEGHSERIQKEETLYGFRKPMTQECELLVRPTGTDLQIVIKDKKRREFKKVGCSGSPF